jgi:hypothetical protein
MRSGPSMGLSDAPLPPRDGPRSVSGRTGSVLLVRSKQKEAVQEFKQEGEALEVERAHDQHDKVRLGKEHVLEERPGFEGSESGVSRRKIIKRLGAGTALAWSAPVLSSLATPAYAQVSPGACPAWDCGQSIIECAGTPCGIGPCVCDLDVHGNPACWDNISCGDPNVIACTANSDCAPGWVCTTNCCGQTCLPPCGECGPGGSEQGPGLYAAGQR